jgi:hypothetical protein
VFNASGIVTIKNTIISGNSGDKPDVAGDFTSTGYNFIGKSNSSTGFVDGVNNDQVGTSALPKDARLLALANRGGPTQTLGLAGDSPVIDKGSATGADQRGSGRPVDLPDHANAPGGNGADIGAFEFQMLTASSVSVSGRVFSPFGRGVTNAVVSITYTNGTTRSTQVGRSGYFRFDDVEAGQTYVFTITSRRYMFAPQVITVLDNLTELNFTAEAASR